MTSRRTQMADKYMCIRDCYRKNPSRQWRLYLVGETDWWDEDPGKHWSKVPSGDRVTPQDMLRQRCVEIGIEVDKQWDVPRLQREYDVQIKRRLQEQDKHVMAGTVAEPDARVSSRVEEPKKRK